MKAKTKAAPSSAASKKKKTPVAKKPKGKSGPVKKKTTSSPRKQQRKKRSLPTPVDVPPVDSAITAPPVDTPPPDAAAPPVVTPPVSKHKWRNRFFIFVFILVLGMLFKTLVFPGADAAATGDTIAADGKKDLLPDGATAEKSGKASWMIWTDVVVMLIAGSTLAWAGMTRGEMWETDEFRKRFESDEQRNDREKREREKAETEGAKRTVDYTHPTYDHKGRDHAAAGV